MTARQRISILSLIVIFLFVGGLYLFHYTPDDTFITLRYARNVARGDGFVFNRGERIEGYSNFLWLIILVIAAKAGLPLLAASRALSLACSVAALCLTRIAAERSATKGGDWNDALTRILPALLLASSAPFLAWSLSGTEMPFFTALLLLGFIFLRDDRRPGAVLAVFGLLGLVRPEGLLFYGLAWIMLLGRRRNRIGVLLAGAGILIMFYAPYLIWKWRYFGSIVPNTFYAKTGPLPLMLRNGAGYLGGFFAGFGYLILLGPLFGRRRFLRERTRLFPVLFVLAHWVSILVLGGDWMPYYRLLLPTLPLIFVSAGDAVAGKWTARDGAAGAGGEEAIPPAGRETGTAVPLVSLLLVLFMIFPGALLYGRFEQERLVVRSFARLGRILHETLPPRTSIGLGSTGAIGYYTDMEIVDILGLTERHIAREGRIVSPQPGHMKTDGAYVLSKEPDLLLLGNVQIHRGKRGGEEMILKVQEREIAAQPSFARDYEFVNIPLGRDFFLSCYKRRDYSPTGAAGR